MRLVPWLATASLCGAAFLAVALATGDGRSRPAVDQSLHGDPVPQAPPPDRGAEVYAFSCAVCHGATGLGFEEAVSAFPEDHQYCTRCHQPQNAAVMPGSQVGLSVMAFSLGEPPALADRERLARFGTAGALYEYTRAAMPRWAPGSLEDDDYLAVTSHLLRMVGILPADEATSAFDLDLRLAAP